MGAHHSALQLVHSLLEALAGVGNLMAASASTFSCDGVDFVGTAHHCKAQTRPAVGRRVHVSKKGCRGREMMMHSRRAGCRVNQRSLHACQQLSPTLRAALRRTFPAPLTAARRCLS